MAEERRSAHRRHTVAMEQRERVSIQGVIDVLSFDDEAVVAETDMGILIIRGENLHVNKLNLENGELFIDGLVDALIYEEEGMLKGGKTSFFSRIFK